MEDANTRPLLDTLIESRELQILKTMVPYLHESQQKTMAMVIKLMEFQKTAALFDSSQESYSEELHACSGESDMERMTKMLGALRGFCSEKELENIDMILNFMEMTANYDLFFNQQ